jgi:hypothetical protein
MQGCRSVDECRALEAEAGRRVSLCRGECEDARVDHALAAYGLDRITSREATDRRILELQREADAWHQTAAQQNEDQKRLVAEAKCSGMREMVAPEFCASGSPEACDKLEAFLRACPDSPDKALLQRSAVDGRKTIDERTREVQAKAYASLRAVVGDPARSSGAGARSDRPLPSAGKCCDGTPLSDRCANGGRGCCSHHGGVCN